MTWIRQTNENQNSRGVSIFVKAKILKKATSLSASTCKRYRSQGLWAEGIHWQRINCRLVLYNLPLILDWIANINNPEAHKKVIEAYLASLSADQPTKGRKNR